MNNVTKEKIRKSFDKAYKTYDENSALHKNTAQLLINMLQQYENKFDIIADFACGTGMNTELLLIHFQSAVIYGIDISKKLLEVAKNKLLHNIIFLNGDFDELTFPRNFLDLAFCNMGLQWSNNLELTLSKIKYQLKNAGIFAFCLPVEGTFIELKALYRNEFYSTKIIQLYLFDLGFELIEYQEKCFIEKFDSAMSALKSIKKIGANIIKNKHNQKGLVSPRAINNRFIDSKEIILTYKIGLFICRRKCENFYSRD